MIEKLFNYLDETTDKFTIFVDLSIVERNDGIELAKQLFERYKNYHSLIINSGNEEIELKNCDFINGFCLKGKAETLLKPSKIGNL